jgi:hypothetical protein
MICGRRDDQMPRGLMKRPGGSCMELSGRERKEAAFMYVPVRSKDVLVENYRCMKVLHPSLNTINTQQERVLKCEPTPLRVVSYRRSRTPTLHPWWKTSCYPSVGERQRNTYNLERERSDDMYALRINLEEDARKKAFLVSVKTTVNQETRNTHEACNQKEKCIRGERRSVCE